MFPIFGLEKNEFEEFSLKKPTWQPWRRRANRTSTVSSIALQKKYAHIEGFFVSKIRFIFCVETAK